MITELIRKVVQVNPGVAPRDAAASLPPAPNSTRTVEVGGSKRGLLKRVATMTTGFIEGAMLIPGVGANWAGRIFGRVEMRAFVESCGYIQGSNTQAGGGEILIEPRESNNWLIDLTSDSYLSFGLTVDISDVEAVEYSQYDRARVSPMTVWVHHNGFRLLPSNFIIPEDFTYPDAENSGVSVFTFVQVNHPDSSRTSPWRLFNVLHFAQ